MQKVFEKIIERLEEYPTYSFGVSLLNTEEYIKVSDLVEIVNQVASEHGGWIPCSERFPNNGDYILLSFSNFSVPLVGRWEEDEDGGAFYIGDETESCVLQDIFVNAWQPLPPVYKAESEE